MADESISGRILLGEAVAFADATAEVVLEDTTYADVPAVPVARWVRGSVAHDGTTGGAIVFTLRRPPPEPGRRYSLRVLLDLDGDGRLGRGDYRNAESVHVPPGTVSGLEVRVKRVG